MTARSAAPWCYDEMAREAAFDLRARGPAGHRRPGPRLSRNHQSRRRHRRRRRHGMARRAPKSATSNSSSSIPRRCTSKARRAFCCRKRCAAKAPIWSTSRGERFMHRYHPLEELAPRDVVSRAIVAEMRATGAPHVFLDLTASRRRFHPRRAFRASTKPACATASIWQRSPRPVHPAAHYAMGGVRTDLDGRTSLPGLYAAGEAACTGVHGANRLASNSLLEGVVFGARAGRAMRESGGSARHSRRHRAAGAAVSLRPPKRTSAAWPGKSAASSARAISWMTARCSMPTGWLPIPARAWQSSDCAISTPSRS